jgi:uncharacterized protein (DUF362 family)/ferredoxin
MMPAWTQSEIRASIATLIARFEGCLPTRLDADIVIKPNLNNDLVALTGNSTDLRVLAAIIEDLQARGFVQITIADGSNVGVDRRGIDTFVRLGVGALAERLGVGTYNLNAGDGPRVRLHGGAYPRVAARVMDCDFLISVPTIKTHVEAGMSCAMKNWVGVVVGQDKRQMHLDLNRNIAAIHTYIQPDLVIVDGIIGMEGNGPGDGDPVRLGMVVASDCAPLCDVAVAKMVGLDIANIPYLGHGIAAGMVSDADCLAVDEAFSVVRAMVPAPKRSRLAQLSEDPRLMWLKRAVRPLTDQPAVASAAYRMGVIQDVYSAEEDQAVGVVRLRHDCDGCTRCADVCPTSLSVERIGVDRDFPDCISCLYCWWACPDEAIGLDGPLLAMARQASRYKTVIESL